jgi:branched-chain amino acid transport system substrate-binding protein
VTRSVQIATGLAERATWNSYVPGISFLSHYVYNAPKNKVNDWLVKKMKRRNQLPDIFTPDGFVAAQMIVRAVQKGGGDDVDKMISALEGWKFLGPKGPQRIRPEDHAMLQPMFQVRLRTVKGKQVPVPVKTFSPGNVAPPVRPFPS